MTKCVASYKYRSHVHVRTYYMTSKYTVGDRNHRQYIMMVSTTTTTKKQQQKNTTRPAFSRTGPSTFMNICYVRNESRQQLERRHLPDMSGGQLERRQSSFLTVRQPANVHECIVHPSPSVLDQLFQVLLVHTLAHKCTHTFIHTKHRVPAVVCSQDST